MGADHGGAWGTWEELVLGGAVLRHGTADWNVVASELRARTLYPFAFTPEACKIKYEELQKRYSGSKAWFDELRKRRVAELKRELAISEDSIGSLESKIKVLEARSQRLNQADVTSQSKSPLTSLHSNSTESFGKDALKDEQSAGSFTEDTTTRKSWREPNFLADETKAKLETMVSSEQDKDLTMREIPEAGYELAVTIRKKRGQRKRKNCSLAVAEGSVGESDNLASSNVASTLKDRLTNDSVPGVRDSSSNKHNGSSCIIRRDSVMEIFESVLETEPAGVFKHRMDSQKRARYRKIIRQHLDIGTIRSRIANQLIKSPKELFRDLLLLANNALVFYSRRTREYKSGLSLRNLVMKEYKQFYRGSYQEVTSAFIPCNPPVKPRSARPRPRPKLHPVPLPYPVPDKVPDHVENNIVPAQLKVLKKPTDSDSDVGLQSLMMKAKNGAKMPGKVKPEVVGDKRVRASPVKQRKRVRK